MEDEDLLTKVPIDVAYYTMGIKAHWDSVLGEFGGLYESIEEDLGVNAEYNKKNGVQELGRVGFWISGKEGIDGIIINKYRKNIKLNEAPGEMRFFEDIYLIGKSREVLENTLKDVPNEEGQITLNGKKYSGILVDNSNSNTWRKLLRKSNE